MIIPVTGKERLGFQYILPGQGDINTLELVEKIVGKIKTEEVKTMEEIIDIDFDKEEITLLKEMINVLSEKKVLNFQSLSLIRKILEQEI